MSSVKQKTWWFLPVLVSPTPDVMPKKMYLSSTVYEQIRETIGSKKAEQGGMLGGKEGGSIVEHFYFDTSAKATGATYTPDHLTINDLLKTQWWPQGIDFFGFVHSHPGYIKHPSTGDREYARTILSAMPSLPYLLLPIVMSVPDTGAFRVIPYAAIREKDDVRIVKLGLSIEDDNLTDTEEQPVMETTPIVSQRFPDLPVILLGLVSLLVLTLATVGIIIKQFARMLRHYKQATSTEGPGDER